MTDAIFKGWTRPGPRPPGGLEAGEGETLDYICGHYRLFQYQRGHRFSAQQLAGGFGPQRCQRGRHAQSRIAPAPDKLQRLRAEFDFANAAFAKLQIMAQHAFGRRAFSRLMRALMRVHALLHGVDIGHGGEIQVAAPDERPHLGQEAPPQRQIARHRPRLYERRPLPGLGHVLIVR